MPKRTSEAAELPAGKSAAIGQETARPVTVEDEDMGEFEDRWEDEVESEHEYEAPAEGEEEDDDGRSIYNHGALLTSRGVHTRTRGLATRCAGQTDLSTRSQVGRRGSPRCRQFRVPSSPFPLIRLALSLLRCAPR